MRTRSRILKNNETGDMDYIRIRSDPYEHRILNSVSYVVDYEDESITDVITPQYHSLSRKGHIINNDMSQTKHRLISSASRCTAVAHYYEDKALTRPAGTYTYDYPHVIRDDYRTGLKTKETMARGSKIQSLYDSVLLEAHASANSGDMQGLVTLAELKKSVDLVKSLGTRLSKLTSYPFYKALKSNAIHEYERFKRVPKGYTLSQIRRLSRQWLEYRYGIRQLLFDYQDIVEMLNKNDYDRTVYRSFGSDSRSEEVSTQLDWWGNFGQRVMTQTNNQQHEVSAGVLVRNRLDFLNVPSALGLFDVIPTMWELTKFSFIVDWFFDVGSWLSALSPNVNREILASWVSYQVTDNFSRASTLSSKSSDNFPIYIGGSYGYNYIGDATVNGTDKITETEKIVTKTRDANPAVPSLPAVKVRLDAQKITDLMALITLQFKRLSAIRV